MTTISDKIICIYDYLFCFWDNKTTHRVVSSFLVTIFIGTLLAIELNRQQFLPDFIASKIPLSHYMAINVAFTLVLILEVISLIFTLPCSLSKSLGKQFEILALIYLRNSFKQLAGLPEPITITLKNEALHHILAYGGGAIVIFALLGIYSHLLKKADDSIKGDGVSLYNFIAAKKAVALFLLIIFSVMGASNGLLLLTHKPTFYFFPSFYTLLIFSDILLVLIAQVYMPQFQAVFRNSGYALATLLIRLALSAPVYEDVIIGIASAFFAVLLTALYNFLYLPRVNWSK